MTSEIIRARQKVPDDFAKTLRALAADATNGGNLGRTEASVRLNAVLMMARTQGWTTSALAEALGISHQAVSKRANQGRVRKDIPDVPLPPRRRTPMPAPPKRQLLIKPEIAERLREMQKIAETVNGATPDDDPRRAVSVEFTAALASLVEQGVTVYQIAKVLGINHNAVRSRLARHGYRKPAPSDPVYLGRQSRGPYTRRPRKTETAPEAPGAAPNPEGINHS